MVSELGIVQEIKKRYAVIKVQRSAACDKCSSNGSCERTSNDVFVEVDNDMNAKEGDLVELSMPEGALLKISFLVYFLPIISLLLGAFLGKALADSLKTSPTALSVSGGLLFMGIEFYYLIRRSKSAKYRDRYRPRITRILPSSVSRQTCDNI
jgi:sigma-E factor negative regulatory protein RseC